jgi:regulator of cell morphogenesis and NO signaling
MITPLNIIDEDALVTELIARDYRTADVLKKHGIDFCCGAGWPLKTACEMRGLDTLLVKQELEAVIRPIQIAASLPFTEWPLDFLADYIVHVHHGYLRQALTSVKEFLETFIAGHSTQFAYLKELEQVFTKLYNGLPASMKQEEEIIFPYIKQVYRAFLTRESFAGLLTRTLRKPVEKVMTQERELVVNTLQKMRELTGNYFLPAGACRSHWVVFMKLKELDNDLVQHLHLENTVLLPRLLTIEGELKKS